MIKAVIFDFGQTLADSAAGFRRAEKQVQVRIFSHLALSLQEKFLENYRRIRQQFHGRSDFSRKSMWREVYHYHCLTPDEDLLEAWENEYWETVKAHTALFPEVVAVLEALSARFSVALITNTQGQPRTGTHRIAQFPQLEPFFKAVVIAGEEGCPPKPDPAPFRICLQALGLPPAEAVYVGDDWRIDICGARDAGLAPVWVKHAGVSRRWPEVEADVPVITRLDQLLELELLRG